MRGSLRTKLLLLVVLAVLLGGVAMLVAGIAREVVTIGAGALVAFALAFPLAHRWEVHHAAKQQRLVLDHVNQGLFAVTYDGVLVGARSRATEALLGTIGRGETLVDIARRYDTRVAAGFELGFAQLASDVLPLELALFQLPRELCARGRTLSFAYAAFTDPAHDDDKRLLVTVTNITEERERAEARDAELESAAFFKQLASDRYGVRRFLEDARTQVDLVGTAPDATVVREALHTLKGNAGLMGLARWVTKCHDAETTLAETGELTAEQRQQFVWAWSATEGRIAPFLEAHSFELSTDDHDALVRIATREESWEALRVLLREITLESSALPLRRLAEHCRKLALRLERPIGAITIEDHGVRLDPHRWSPLWSVLTHVVRNVVIHGMSEDAPTDVAFRTFAQRGGVAIEIVDEGRGIQWDDLRARARAAGMAAATREDLIAAMFSHQISTHHTVDELAGRGVGLAAVATTCRKLGVRVEVPVRARGTMFRFHIPAAPLVPVHTTTPLFRVG